MSTSHAIILLHTALDTVRTEHDKITSEINKMKALIAKEEERLATLAKKMQEIQEALTKLEAMPAEGL